MLILNLKQILLYIYKKLFVKVEDFIYFGVSVTILIWFNWWLYSLLLAPNAKTSKQCIQEEVTGV